MCCQQGSGTDFTYGKVITVLGRQLTTGHFGFGWIEIGF
jgi:hypothetical protein